MITRGFDASVVQGIIPWDKLDPSIRFGIFKCYQGNDGKDPNFDRNVKECVDSGRIAGAYCFDYPLPHLDPRVQAQTFFEQSGHFGTNIGELPLFIDLEWPEINDWPKWKCSATQISDWSAVHLEECTKLWGNAPTLYIYDWWWEYLAAHADVSWAKAYSLFMAWYIKTMPEDGDSPKIPKPWDNWTFWQHDGNGGFKLPNGADSDFCVFNGSETDLITLAHGPSTRNQEDFDIVHAMPITGIE